MKYHLFEIFRIIGHKRSTILLIVTASIGIGIGLYFLLPKKYEAACVFILKNPIFSDRNNVYSYEAKFLSYTASDEDVDQMISMASSDTLENTVIRKMHLAAAYHFDSTDAEEVQKLKKAFQKNIKIFRNEYKCVILSYTDTDPVRAAAIANLCVNLLESSVRGFYNNMRLSLYNSIMNKIRQEDSSIAILTDSLTTIREHYGIYDIISPMRNTLVSGSVKGSGGPGLARGIEIVQNIESVKDELVADRAKHITLANQYTTGTEQNEIPLTQVLQSATPPFKHIPFDTIKTGIVSGILGFLFAVIYVLMMEFFRRLKSGTNDAA
jgi:uncharacterized protein involved in exopolysaccharide biosynthesis